MHRCDSFHVKQHMSSFIQTWPWKLRNTANKKQHQTHATHAQSSQDHRIYYFLAQAREHRLTFCFLPACYFEVQQHHVLTKPGNTWFSRIEAPNIHLTFHFKDRTHTHVAVCEWYKVIFLSKAGIYTGFLSKSAATKQDTDTSSQLVLTDP
jgi:hypothetical protein